MVGAVIFCLQELFCAWKRDFALTRLDSLLGGLNFALDGRMCVLKKKHRVARNDFCCF